MSLLDKAANLSGKAVDKVDHMVLDDMLVKTIIRCGKQKDRINRMLEEENSPYCISGIEVDDTMPPKVVFIIGTSPEKTEKNQA